MTTYLREKLSDHQHSSFDKSAVVY